MDELVLQWRRRDRADHANADRRFLDFVVGGRSLYDAHRRDLISPLGWGVPEWQDHTARKLLGEASADIEEGRVAIYVCPECGDVSCGSITVQLTREPGVVTWADAANSWLDSGTEGWHHDPLGWPTLRFEEAAYRRILTRRTA